MPGAPHFHMMTGLVSQQAQGMAMVYRMMQQQASLLAYNDIYRTLALAAAIFAPGFLLLKRTRAGEQCARPLSEPALGTRRARNLPDLNSKSRQ